MGMPVEPAFDQDTFRFRDNVPDPSGVDAAFDAGDTAANTNISYQTDTLIRVRFLIQQTVSSATNTANQATEFRLQYNNTTQATGWVNVGTSASSEDVRLRLATGFADHANTTTARLGAGTLVTGDGVESSQTTDTVTFTDEALSETELEFAIEIVGAQVDDSDTIQLRVIHSNDDESPPATVLDSYTNTPTVTASKPSPQSITAPAVVMTLGTPAGTITATGAAPITAPSVSVTASPVAGVISGSGSASITGAVVSVTVTPVAGVFAHVYPDVLVDGSASGQIDSGYGLWGPYWTDENTAAIIYMNSSFQVVASKTTDGGANWGTPSVVEAGSAFVGSVTAWFDRETPGDSGDKVHVVWPDLDDDEIKYASYDIGDGSWSGVTTVVATGIAISGACRTFLYKTLAGGFVTGWGQAATGSGCFKSSDGSSWSSIANAWESASDYWIGVHADTDDDNDAAILFNDTSTNVVSIKVYDDSADSWTETSVATGITSATTLLNWGRSTRLSDGHVILALWSLFNAAGNDVEAYDLNINSVASPGVTALTDVVADDQGGLAGVFIDQTTDDIYVAYARGTDILNLVQVFYKKSTDGGSAWGSEQAYQTNDEDDIRFISGGAMGPTQGGQFQPSFYNEDLTDVFVNTSNAVSIAPVVLVTQPYYVRTGGVPGMRIGRPGAVFGRSW